MKLQTQIPLLSGEDPIDYQSQLLLIGSCFVENMGEQLEYYKFRLLQNRFGILFHPQAIENFVVRAIEGKTYGATDIFFHNERWYCFDAHSNLSDSSEQGLLHKLNTAIKDTSKQIKQSTHIIITLGTSWVYRYKSTGSLVANCHKMPQKLFSKELLSVDAITTNMENMVRHIKSINPGAKIIFTVSPVRHLKDGFVENQQSKAHLFTAIHQVINGSKLSYFPSYEIQMDELRDYRFYGADMVHPNKLAIDYIWEKFKSAWISEQAYAVMEQVEEVQKGLSHRPFNPESDQHKKFVQSLQGKITALKKGYPFMEFVLPDVN